MAAKNSWLTSGIAALGFAVSLGLLIVVLVAGPMIENAVQRMGISEVEARLIEFAENPTAEDQLEGKGLRDRLALGMARRAEDAFGLVTLIGENAGELVRTTLGPRCLKSCQQYSAILPGDMTEKILSLPAPGEGSFRDLINREYDQRIEALNRDLIIILATNTLAFGLIFVISAIRTDLFNILLKLEFGLLGALCFTFAFFVIGQDWMVIFLTNDFLGWSYVAIMGVVFLFLCDGLFLGWAITNAIIEATMKVLSSLTPS